MKFLQILFLCVCLKGFTCNEISTLHLPVVDISLLRSTPEDAHFCEKVAPVANAVSEASQDIGFFYIRNHGVSEELTNSLINVAKEFFDLPAEVKYQIAMNTGGKAWRGYFGVGDEVTSGIPDQKEGIYYGTELNNSDPRPMHGANLWPEGDLGDRLKPTVLEYMSEMKQLGRLLMKAITCSLDIREPHFLDQFDNPTELFRIFHYPPHDAQKFSDLSMGVGEHTDYGYLTILKQDPAGGLQVRSLQNAGEWLEAPPLPGTFVVNLGDALEHNTQGLFRATPHRVLQRLNAENGRISMPYFFDPSFDAEMKSMVPFFGKEVIVPDEETERRVAARWDKLDPTLFQGTYGNYLLKKVSRAFPALFAEQIQSTEGEETKEL
jgi:isopenicillin N synthase-like dioxygenase